MHVTNNQFSDMFNNGGGLMSSVLLLNLLHSIFFYTCLTCFWLLDFFFRLNVYIYFVQRKIIHNLFLNFAMLIFSWSLVKILYIQKLDLKSPQDVQLQVPRQAE